MCVAIVYRGVRQMRRHRVVRYALAGLLLVGSGLAALGRPAVAAPPDAAAAVTCAKTAADEASARRAAMRCQTRVEIMSARSERAQAFSNPDGTTSWESAAAPRRVHRPDGSWAPVDRRLRAWGGRVAPTATVADVSFSLGGGGPMVVLRKKGHTFTLDWPGVLPSPTLSGERATYANVLPDVDLVLRATTSGFTHVLVVRTARAAADPALARIAYRIGGDVTVTATAKGLLAKAADATTLASTRSASMWDSSMQAPAGSAAEKAGLRPEPSTVDGPGDAARRSTLSVTVEGGALVVAADPTFLTDPGRGLPIYVDPSWDADSSDGAYWGYTMYPYTENGDGRAWVGLDPWWGQVYRSYFEFPTSAGGVSLIGKHILSAQFNITLSHSWSCGPSPVYLWWTDHIYWAGHVDWAPYLIAYVQEAWANANKAGNVCPVQPDVPMGFTGDNAELAGYVQSIVNAGWGSFALSLAAFDVNWNGEYDQSRWKKFWPDTATLVVNYNSYPNQPASLRTSPFSACRSTADPADTAFLPRVNANNAGAGLVLRTNLSDPDGGLVRGRFEVWPKATEGSAGQVYNGPFTELAASGTTFQATVPSTAMTEGTAYGWRTHASDDIDYSNWSPWCEFVVDNTPPAQPQVASTELNGRMAPSLPGTPTAVVKVARPSPVTFTPASGTPAGEVAGYLYGLNTATKWVAADANGAATVMVEPLTSGFAVNKLLVIAVDRAGNRSPLPSAGYSYGFKANAGTAAWWPTRNAATPLVDVAAAKNMDLTGAASVGYGTATFGGGQAATTGQVLTTNASFTVAAWVRVTGGGATRAVVSQAGTKASAFYLQYQPGTGKWRFALPTADAASPTFVELTSSQPAVLGTWTHLTGVYDSSAKQIRLYVNGVLDGTVSYTGKHWSATGKFRIGQEQVNSALVNPMAGDIADVRAWGSTMDAAGIAALAKLPPAALEWGMDDPGAPQLADTSGLATSHNGTLSAGAGMALGHRGGALAVNGPAPSGASTTGVVHTNGSFSVSAWVRVSTLSSGFVNAVSADGAAVGMFGLGTDPGNRWVFWMHSNDSVACDYAGALAGSGPTPGVWAHLAATYNVATNQLALYVNGTLAATATMTTPWDATQRFAIGFGRWDSADNYQWQGDIDDVRAFQGVLSPAQIAYLATL
jgi:Concanavalin A-like lectin/glucanases superfamily